MKKVDVIAEVLMLQKCSFCSKTRKQVKILIVDRFAGICDECVALCTEIIEENRLHALERSKQDAEREEG